VVAEGKEELKTEAVTSGPATTAESKAETGHAEGKGERPLDQRVQAVAERTEAILQSMARHGLMTPRGLKEHTFSLRSADGVGDSSLPEQDGIDFMSINFAPLGLDGQSVEDVVQEALFSPIGGIFPVVAERSFPSKLPDMASAIDLLEQRMRSSMVIILKTDSKASQIEAIEGSVHWGEMVLDGGIPAADIQYILAPTALSGQVARVFREQGHVTVIAVEDSATPLHQLSVGIALDQMEIPGFWLNQGRSILRELLSSPSLSAKKLSLPNYQRALGELMNGPLKNTMFFEYAARLPVLQDVPFLVEQEQRSRKN
jgi:hypothetical protein